eukprot:CAMPEP_0113543870 /NCGR_PEP_ID=MMETSP0015_2-20120614/10395_1 /TAXON_ID=2838 /ORGANISM="Odontella" /LENGTH=462 /DNA_ID=CAMNT_0000444071 /DNA_START=86 /DNA_END=1474 /DNA_ORIENTATION=- /assembly_acc=CAM_ASM_000160
MSFFSSEQLRREINGVGRNNLSAVEAAEALTQLFGGSLSRRDSMSSLHCVSDDESSSSSSSSSASLTKPKAKQSSAGSEKTSNKPEMFPLRLHRMLSDPSVRETITWLPHGEAFAVLLPDLFAESVLPKYFPESAGGRGARKSAAGAVNKAKYPSFTRKLNRWGFRQINKGPDSGAFHHPLFRRADVELCRGMECQKSGKSGRAKKTATDKAPKESEPADKKTTTSKKEAPLLVNAAPSHMKIKSFESSKQFGLAPSRIGAKTCEKSIGSRIKVEPASVATESPPPRRSSVPLKKRNFSHLLVPAPTDPLLLATTVLPASASSSSLSETPFLPAPRRVSSFTEKVDTAPSMRHCHLQHHHHHQQGNEVDFESTLHRLQASMERARAGREAWEQRLSQRLAAAAVGADPFSSSATLNGGVPSTAAWPHGGAPSTAAQPPLSDATAEAHHKSMLYTAFLQAMHT